MRIADPFIAELDQEAAATRRVLARVPTEHLSWRPHPKSMSLGQLALHVAQIPGSVAQLVARDVTSLPPFVQREAATSAELLPALDESLATARALLDGWSDDDMQATWSLSHDGRTLMALQRAALVRAIMLNHWYHHRGQLLVYLRMHDVPLPSVYGPTADDNPFAGQA
jgi:uncharacterized damage-inducible protein DinB